MMTQSIWDKRIVELTHDDVPSISAHFRRLNEEILYSRFGNVVTEAFLVQYADRLSELGTIVLGCRVNRAVRGIAELRRLRAGSDPEAEAAFTVEEPFLDLGIGTALMGAALATATRVGIRDLYMCFDHRNRRMRRITEKFQGSVSVDGRDCIGRVSAVSAATAPDSRAPTSAPVCH
jgi:GNAT superfamily N-acetyltransferase